MRRVPAACVIAAVSWVLAPLAFAQCVDSDREVDQEVGYNCISLNLIGFPPTMSGAVASAAGDWNDPSCNERGDSFPEFEIGGECLLQISVVWNQGVNPRNEFSPGNFSGSTINVYSQTRNPVNGSLISAGSATVVRDTVAHELGHTLGLKDRFSSSCQGFAMAQLGVRQTSPPTFQDRSVRGAECQKAAATNLTPAERGTTDPPGPIHPSDNPPCEQVGCSPILIDLGRRGFGFSSASNGANFDIDADGFAEEISWVDPSFEDGFLVLDRNSNGVIDSGLELFGNVTAQPMVNELNGFQALSVFDFPLFGGNSDGWISAQDAVFDLLRIWSDSDSDGLSSPEEMLSLAESGIRRIAIGHVRVGLRDSYGNEIRWASVVQMTNGNYRLAVDVIFVENESDE